jgi:hypothetical protein
MTRTEQIADIIKSAMREYYTNGDLTGQSNKAALVIAALPPAPDSERAKAIRECVADVRGMKSHNGNLRAFFDEALEAVAIHLSALLPPSEGDVDAYWSDTRLPPIPEGGVVMGARHEFKKADFGLNCYWCGLNKDHSIHDMRCPTCGAQPPAKAIHDILATKDWPHVQAAFINAIREEGTVADACDFLQKQWNETCALRRFLRNLIPPSGGDA